MKYLTSYKIFENANQLKTMASKYFSDLDNNTVSMIINKVNQTSEKENKYQSFDQDMRWLQSSFNDGIDSTNDMMEIRKKVRNFFSSTYLYLSGLAESVNDVNLTPTRIYANTTLAKVFGFDKTVDFRKRLDANTTGILNSLKGISKEDIQKYNDNPDINKPVKAEETQSNPEKTQSQNNTDKLPVDELTTPKMESKIFEADQNQTDVATFKKQIQGFIYKNIFEVVKAKAENVFKTGAQIEKGSEELANKSGSNVEDKQQLIDTITKEGDPQKLNQIKKTVQKITSQ